MAVLFHQGVSPVQLELEMTETALLRYPKQASDLLDQLGAAGFRIAIDDFGTGYSSLVNLHIRPVAAPQGARLRQLPGVSLYQSHVRRQAGLLAGPLIADRGSCLLHALSSSRTTGSRQAGSASSRS